MLVLEEGRVVDELWYLFWILGTLTTDHLCQCPFFNPISNLILAAAHQEIISSIHSIDVFFFFFFFPGPFIFLLNKLQLSIKLLDIASFALALLAFSFGLDGSIASSLEGFVLLSGLSSETPDMVPPLFVKTGAQGPGEPFVPFADVMLEGQFTEELKEYVLPAGATSKMFTLSFTPGRKFIEDLMHHTEGEVDEAENRHGYQFWDLRVEIEDAGFDGDEDGDGVADNFVAANTFGTYSLIVPEKRWLSRPRNEASEFVEPGAEGWREPNPITKPPTKKERKAMEEARAEAKAEAKAKAEAEKEPEAAGDEDDPDFDRAKYICQEVSQS